MKRTPCWSTFIGTEGAVPAILKAKNHSGGLYTGRAFCAWHFDGTYFSIWNMAGNAVWSHKKNFEIVSRGTVAGLSKDLPFTADWQELKNSINKRLCP